MIARRLRYVRGSGEVYARVGRGSWFLYFFVLVIFSVNFMDFRSEFVSIVSVRSSTPTMQVSGAVTRLTVYRAGYITCSGELLRCK